MKEKKKKKRKTNREDGSEGLQKSFGCGRLITDSSYILL